MASVSKTQLKIEQVDPGTDGSPGGVRLTATVPWSEMATSVMDRFVERRVAVPHDTTPKDEDEVYVSGDEAIDYDAMLIVGAVPAVVAAVGRLRPSSVYGVLNGYAWEMERERDRIEGKERRNRDQELWLTAQLTAVSKLLRELRFAELQDLGHTRAELVKGERLIGASKLAAERWERSSA